MFDPEKFVTNAVAELKEEVFDKAIIAASGGIDSTVATVLAHRAIGDNLIAVFVDTGYMRENEPEQVLEMFNELGIDICIVDAHSEFFEALKNVTDPEQKRKIIGEKFIRVFEREAMESEAKFLVQGTIAPDWIESGGGLRDVIKSHHNVGALPEDIMMELVEPLRDIYKDEVRKVARFLKIPSSERQP
ncbi:MAG: 7-cyano-7-deazaguanine synthase, partial [Thermoplasmata archaeon]|nr:7-cyano-7-deazaguanine synthase [Thermoplasmata archaeon]